MARSVMGTVGLLGGVCGSLVSDWGQIREYQRLFNAFEGERGKKKPVADVPKSGRNPIIESRSSVTGKTTDTFSYDANLLLQ